MKFDVTSDDAIHNIVATYSDTLLRIAYQRTNDKFESEDIVQNVYLAMLKKKVFNDGEHLKSWLIRATINKCKDFRKSIKRREEQLSEQNTVFTTEESELLYEIKMLPILEQSIIYLHYYEGYTTKEIGKLLHKSENAVCIRLTRARKQLKAYLTGGEEE